MRTRQPLPCSLLFLLSCGAKTGLLVESEAALGDAGSFASAFRCGEGAQLDVVYVLDTSFTAAGARRTYARRLGELLVPLTRCAAVRLGVITADLGVGMSGVPTCTADGDRGRLLRIRSDARFIEGDTRTLAEEIADFVERLPVGCGFERPLEALVRMGSGPEFVEFHRPGAPLLLAHMTDEDDCSARDDSFYQPDGPWGAIPENPRCFVAPESELTSLIELADGALGLSSDPIVVGVWAGVLAGDLEGGEGPPELLALARRYASFDRWNTRGCEGAILPSRLLSWAARLQSRGAQVAIGGPCSASPQEMGAQLIVLLQHGG